jgi:hypothetical protein
MKTTNDVDGKIEALRKKQSALKAAIAREVVRAQEKRRKDDGRLFAITGEAVIRSARRSPQFELMLKQVLQSAEMRDTDRAYLAGKGWL